MSKQQQFEAEEKQRFIVQGQIQGGAYPQYPQQQPQAMYVQQPMYVQGAMPMQPYPPSVVVVNQIAPAYNGWRDPGCCTICWGVFLLIGAIIGSIGGITTVAQVNAGIAAILYNCQSSSVGCSDQSWSLALQAAAFFRSYAISAMSSSLITLLLTVAVVVFYCKKSTSASARAWNYTCWILIALMQSGIVALWGAIALFVTGSSILLKAAITQWVTAYGNLPLDPAVSSTVDTILSIFSIMFWVLAAVSAIPMIISSVVAHKNKAPCKCSGQTDYVD